MLWTTFKRFQRCRKWAVRAHSLTAQACSSRGSHESLRTTNTFGSAVCFADAHALPRRPARSVKDPRSGHECRFFESARRPSWRPTPERKISIAFYLTAKRSRLRHPCASKAAFQCHKTPASEGLTGWLPGQNPELQRKLGSSIQWTWPADHPHARFPTCMCIYIYIC